MLAAFLLGVAVGPVMGWERQTVVVDQFGSGGQRVRRLTAEGWIVSRRDGVESLGTLVTLERLRADGLTRSIGDVFNNAASWLAWATGSGAYSQR